MLYTKGILYPDPDPIFMEQGIAARTPLTGSFTCIHERNNDPDRPTGRSLPGGHAPDPVRPILGTRDFRGRPGAKGDMGDWSRNFPLPVKTIHAGHWAGLISYHIPDQSGQFQVHLRMNLLLPAIRKEGGSMQMKSRDKIVPVFPGETVLPKYPAQACPGHGHRYSVRISKNTDSTLS